MLTHTLLLYGHEYMRLLEPIYFNECTMCTFTDLNISCKTDSEHYCRKYMISLAW